MSKKKQLPSTISDINKQLNDIAFRITIGDLKNFNEIKNLKKQKARILTTESLKGIVNE